VQENRSYRGGDGHVAKALGGVVALVLVTVALESSDYGLAINEGNWAIILRNLVRWTTNLRSNVGRKTYFRDWTACHSKSFWTNSRRVIRKYYSWGIVTSGLASSVVVARIGACGTNESHIGANIIIWEIARGRTRCRWGENCGKIPNIRCEKRIGNVISGEHDDGHLHVWVDSFSIIKSEMRIVHLIAWP